MGDIVEFLKARLAEDEAVVNELEDHYDSATGIEVQTASGYPCERYLTIEKARVLRDIAAKRAIIGLHRPELTTVEWWDAPDTGEALTCPTCAAVPNEWDLPVGAAGVKPDGWVSGYVLTPCPTLRHLAAIWAEHPDFDASWTVTD